MSQLELVTRYIRDVQDFPKPGILFKDITPMLGHADAFRASIELMKELVEDLKPDVIVAIESRGFLFGAPLAIELGAGFVPVRKPGKLPYEKISSSYDLEYGKDTLEMHVDAIRPGARVLLIDDVIATGGTAAAAIKLAQSCGGNVVGAAFFVELTFLSGGAKLAPCEVRSVLKY